MSKKTRSGSAARAATANAIARDVPHLAFRATAVPTQDLLQIEDRRTYWPGHLATQWEPAVRLSGSPARLQAAQKPVRASNVYRLGSPPSRILFKAPKRVLVCVRRRQRREVLLALGRGGGYHRPPRRNVYSNVHCR